MANLQALAIVLFISFVAHHLCSVNAQFYESMYLNWGAHHSSILGNGEELELVLDQSSGSGVQSYSPYLFGSTEMLIKLVPGNSAGTVTAYYVSVSRQPELCIILNDQFSQNLEVLGEGLTRIIVYSNTEGRSEIRLSSSGDQHDEIDFEFLGNSSGEPYIVHTNVFTQGVGNKEQQFYLWFDPTAEFHNYTIHWNPTAIVWYIDSIPIRVFRNYENEGIAYPNKQGMVVYSSLWNADNWATRGGLVKIDWNSAPFVARYRDFKARSCPWEGERSISQCAASSPENWWTSDLYKELSYAKQGQMKWARDNYMIYDYCRDTNRFNGQMPSECSKAQY